MAINIDNMQIYSNSDLLIMYRWGLANMAAGQTRTYSGGGHSRTVTFPPLKEMLMMVEWLTDKVEGNDDSTDMFARVRFDR